MFLAAVNPLIIIIAAAIALVVVIGAVIGHLNSKMAYDKIELFCKEQNLTYRLAENSLHDFEIEGDNYILCVKIADIPKNSSVTINSKDTWCLRFGGHRVGRSYPNKRYLSELKSFLAADYTKSLFFENEKGKKVQKVVILNPSTEKLLKYINECEIIEITSKDLAYDVKVIQFDKLAEEYKNLL